MKLDDVKLGVMRLPADVEIPLYLIREGLVAHVFFNGLSKVGFDESRFYGDFGNVVLKTMGFDTLDDDLLIFYMNLLEKYTDGIEQDSDSYTRSALLVYLDVLTEQRRRKFKTY